MTITGESILNIVYDNFSKDDSQFLIDCFRRYLFYEFIEICVMIFTDIPVARQVLQNYIPDQSLIMEITPKDKVINIPANIHFLVINNTEEDDDSEVEIDIFAIQKDVLTFDRQFSIIIFTKNPKPILEDDILRKFAKHFKTKAERGM